MVDVFLYAGEPSPNDVRLRDPTQVQATAGVVSQEFQADARPYYRNSPEYLWEGFQRGPLSDDAVVVGGIGGVETPQDISTYARRGLPLDYSFQRGPVTVERQAAQEAPADIREYVKPGFAGFDYSFLHGPVTVDRQASQEFPADIREYAKKVLFGYTFSLSPLSADVVVGGIASLEFPADLAAYSKRQLDLHSFQHGPVTVDRQASQEFPADVRQYAQKTLSDYTQTQPSVRPNNRELASQEFPHDLREYVRPGLDRDYTHTLPPVRPNNRELASQEFPVDISEYIRKPLPDYTHTLPPVRPNNRELASQEFPVDAKLYVKPGLDRDWTVSQPPVRPNNRELASQEFPQDASSYTRHGPDVYSFQHGPVYVDIDGIPISALPEAWQFNRGRQPDLGFTLGPVGQDQIPEGLSDAEWPDDAWWYTKPRIEYGFTTGPTQDPGSISPEAGITDAEWPDDTWWYTRPWAQAVYEQVIYPEILIAQWLPNPSPAPPSGGSFGGISGFSMGGYGTFTAPPSIPMPRPGPLPNLKGFRNVTEVAQNVAKLEGVEFQALPPQVQQGLLEALGEVLGCVGDVFSISSISEGDMQSYKDEKQLRTVTPIAFDGLREIFRLWRAK